MDPWVYRHRHEQKPGWDYVNKRLREAEVDDDVNNLLRLSKYLFGNGQMGALMSETADYVLKGGLYGDGKRGSASEVAEVGVKIKNVCQ